jgi:hypothetical protein
MRRSSVRLSERIGNAKVRRAGPANLQPPRDQSRSGRRHGAAGRGRAQKSAIDQTAGGARAAICSAVSTGGRALRSRPSRRKGRRGSSAPAPGAPARRRRGRRRRPAQARAAAQGSLLGSTIRRRKAGSRATGGIAGGERLFQNNLVHGGQPYIAATRAARITTTPWTKKNQSVSDDIN